MIPSIAQKMKLTFRGVKPHVRGHTCIRNRTGTQTLARLPSKSGSPPCRALLLEQFSEPGTPWSFCTLLGSPLRGSWTEQWPSALKERFLFQGKKGKHTHFTGNNIFLGHLTVSKGTLTELSHSYKAVSPWAPPRLLLPVPSPLVHMSRLSPCDRLVRQMCWA